MAEEPQQQRDDRAARKQQLNGQIRARVACDLNQCVHDAFTLSFRRAGDSVHPDEGHAMGRAYSADFGSRPICCPFVSSRGGNCPYDRPVNRIAIHDVERMIRGNIVWAAWEEGGFWGVDISDIHRPDAAAWFVPPVGSDSARGTAIGTI